jgi:hypothetical protein
MIADRADLRLGNGHIQSSRAFCMDQATRLLVPDDPAILHLPLAALLRKGEERDMRWRPMM